jgi:hypothetical protein
MISFPLASDSSIWAISSFFMKISRDIRNLEFIASVTNTGNKTLVPDFHRFHDTGD